MSRYWVALGAAIVTSMAGQTLLKGGAAARTFAGQLASWQTLLGLCLYGGASLLYMVALRRIPMSVALPCTAVSYVAALLVGYFAYSEPLGIKQVAAILFISTGVALLAAS